MLGLRAKSSIGLDIGTHSIKLVQILKTHSGFLLQEVRQKRIEFEPQKPESDRRKATVDALREILRDVDLRKSHLTLALPGQSSFIRYIKLPPVAPGKIKQIIRYEAQQQVPFPLDEVIWSYQVLEDKGAPELSVILAAVKSELVENILAMLRSMRIDPDVIDVCPLSLYNCAKITQQLPSEGLGMLLDFGAQGTDLVIEKDGRLDFTRAIPVGGDDITEAIAQKLGVEFSEAERIKISGGEEVDFTSSLEAIIAEIRRTVNYYLAQVGRSYRISKILVSGGGANLPGIRETLRNNFNTEVEFLRPFELLGGEFVAPEGFSEIALGVGLGAALRAVIKCPAEVNLLPLRLIRAKEFREKSGYFVSTAILLLLMMGMRFAFNVQEYNLKKERLKAVESMLKKYQPYELEIEKLRKERKKLEGKISQIKNAVQGRFYWSDFLLELSRVTPSFIQISELSVTSLEGGGTVSLSTMESGEGVSGGAYLRREMALQEGRAPLYSSGTEAFGRERRAPSWRSKKRVERSEKGKTLSGSSVRIEGIANNLQEVDEYQTRLKSSPLFEGVKVMSVDEKEKVVSFVMVLRLRPGG